MERPLTGLPVERAWCTMEKIKWVIYVDLDAFYLSCELRRKPELVGKPAIVAHDPKEGKGRGVVLSASYEARPLGFRSAMPVKKAWEMRDKVAWIKPDFLYYETVSEELMGYLKRVSADRRVFSIDEAALPTEPLTVKEVEARAKEIQAGIMTTFSLPSSMGVATSITLAKMASDKAKPRGVCVVPPEQVQYFVSNLPVRRVPGIGPVAESALKDIGVTLVADARKVSLQRLTRSIGAMATLLSSLSRGEVLEEPWPEEAPPLSYGAMITFDQDITQLEGLEKEMAILSDDLGKGVKRKGQLFRAVTVRVRWADMSSVQRSRTIPHPTDSESTLKSLSCELLQSIISEAGGASLGVRTLGLTVHDLKPVDKRQRRLAISDQ